MAQKEKIHHQKIKNIFEFKSKRWSIAVFLVAAVMAYGVQAFLHVKFDPDVVQANMMTNRIQEHEAFMINTDYEIIENDLDNPHYMYPGELEGHVFTFKIQGHEKLVTFNGLKLNLIGNISDDLILNPKLYEGEEVIAEGKVKNNTIDFRNFNSILQDSASKEFAVKIDLSGSATSGSRFRLQIEEPYSLGIRIDGEQIYSLGAYPIRGAYTSIVGFRK